MALSPVAVLVLLGLLPFLMGPQVVLRRRTFVRAYGVAIGVLSGLVMAGMWAAHSRQSGWSLDMPMFLNGACVIDAWTSPSYTPSDVDLFANEMRNLHVDQLVRHSHGPLSTPEIAIGLYIDPRALWFFAGQRATLAVALPDPVLIESIRMRGHPSRTCLPRDVNVWGLVSRSMTYKIMPSTLNWPSTGFPSELETRPDFGVTSLRRVLMGSYPMWLPLAQLRDVPRTLHDNDYPVDDVITLHGIAVHAIALEFRHNWGSDYTCFAGLGIAGDVV